MALFGQSRDVSMIRLLNRELMGNIISEQCVYYKYVLSKTNTNMYGEAAGGKNFAAPVLLNCLIERGEQEHPTSDLGVDLKRGVIFRFLKDDLVDATLVPEIGDIIMFQEGYFEVDTAIENQLFVGKDPNYPYDINPINPGLEEFGYNVSIICKTHEVPADRLNIIKARL